MGPGDRHQLPAPPWSARAGQVPGYRSELILFPTLADSGVFVSFNSNRKGSNDSNGATALVRLETGEDTMTITPEIRKAIECLAGSRSGSRSIELRDVHSL